MVYQDYETKNWVHKFHACREKNVVRTRRILSFVSNRSHVVTELYNLFGGNKFVILRVCVALRLAHPVCSLLIFLFCISFIFSFVYLQILLLLLFVLRVTSQFVCVCVVALPIIWPAFGRFEKWTIIIKFLCFCYTFKTINKNENLLTRPWSLYGFEWNVSVIFPIISLGRVSCVLRMENRLYYLVSCFFLIFLEY